MPTKKVVLIVLASVALAAALTLTILHRPRSFQESMGGSFDPEQVDLLQVFLSPLSGEDNFEFELTPEDDDYWALVNLLDSQRYRCKFPYNPYVVYGHPTSLDHSVYLCFLQDRYPYCFACDGYQEVQFLTPDQIIPDFTVVGLNSEESTAFQRKIWALLYPLGQEAP